MNKIADYGTARGRLHRSARVVKAFFEHKLKLKLELLTHAPEQPLVHGVQFDLSICRWGIWGVRSSKPLSDQNQAEIAALFHGLLGAMENLEDRRSDLMQLEERLRGQIDAAFPENVIPLRRTRPALPGFSTTTDRRWLIKLDCLIESPHVSEIHKMALELHSHSPRFAFLDYRDVDPSAYHSVTDLLGLGPVTLFVPSILDLVRSQQETLRGLIETSHPDRPLLMVGASLPYSELRTDHTIDPEFLILLSRAYIKLTRPFAEYKDKGLMKFFLDSLESPTSGL